jgi:AGZA family xanthine/uracil permease-like MFS transporter
MARQISQINWRYLGDVLPSFVVMTFIPFSYSVAYGLIAGIFVYAVLNGLIALTVRLSGGRIEPSEYDFKEHWSWKGSGKKPWLVRALRGQASLHKVDDKSSTQSFHMSGQERVFSSDSRRVSLDHTDGPKSITMPMRALTPRGSY